jgi:outer membrane lipoprotein-sorting protein
MIPKTLMVLVGSILASLLLTGCPKKMVRVPPPPMPRAENPLETLLEAFSTAQTLQAKASIRIDTVSKGEEMNYRIQGIVFYKKPGTLRVLGYNPFPLPMDLFDALYEEGEFFLLVPFQKKAYTGEVSEFKDLIKKSDIRMAAEKSDAHGVPDRIRIDIVEKKTSIDIRLREVQLNVPLPEDSFAWTVPEGVEVRPLDQLIRRKPSS